MAAPAVHVIDAVVPLRREVREYGIAEIEMASRSAVDPQLEDPLDGRRAPRDHGVVVDARAAPAAPLDADDLVARSYAPPVKHVVLDQGRCVGAADAHRGAGARIGELERTVPYFYSIRRVAVAHRHKGHRSRCNHGALHSEAVDDRELGRTADGKERAARRAHELDEALRAGEIPRGEIRVPCALKCDPVWNP